MTLHGTNKEKDDLKDLEKIIKDKTGGKSKICTIISDLRSEDACKQLVKQHIDFHGGKLDTLCVGLRVFSN